MKIEKLNKCKLGNFELKPKHIYAKNKLNNIVNILIKKYINQSGGAQETVNKNNLLEHINKNGDKSDNFYTEDDLTKLINHIRTQFQLQNNDPTTIKELNLEFDELMKIDKEMNDEFIKAHDIYTSPLIVDADKVKQILIKIQKQLFNLQVNIIFTKLKKIKKIAILPIFKVLEKKIENMNTYMNKLSSEFDKQNLNKYLAQPATHTHSTESAIQPVIPTPASTSTNLNTEYANFDNDSNVRNAFKFKIIQLLNINDGVKTEWLSLDKQINTYNSLTLINYLNKNQELKNMIEFINTKINANKDSNDTRIETYADLAAIENYEIFNI